MRVGAVLPFVRPGPVAPAATVGGQQQPGMRPDPRVHVCTTVRSVISTSGDKKTTIGW